MAIAGIPLARFFFQGQVAAGALVNVYQSGTTTPAVVYADNNLTTPLTNPVVCDSNGEIRFFVASAASLRLYVTTSGGTLINDLDPVLAIPLSSGSATPQVGGGRATLASASTVNLGSVPEASITITGTVPITSFGSSAATGSFKFLTFTAATQLTHNATSMILPTAANITAAAGDTALCEHLGSGNWRVHEFNRASGRAVSSPDIQFQQFNTSGAFTFTTPSNITSSTRFKITLTGAGGSGANFFGGTGCGGNSGATCIAYVTGLTPSTGYSGTIGAGGASTSTNNTPGNAGGNTTITIGATTYTAGGGAGGTNTATPAANATATNGTLNISGTAPPGGSSASTASSGAASYWGGGGRGNASGAGESGGAPGAGGGVAGGSGSASGPGANGIALVEWVA